VSTALGIAVIVVASVAAFAAVPLAGKVKSDGKGLLIVVGGLFGSGVLFMLGVYLTSGQ